MRLSPVARGKGCQLLAFVQAAEHLTVARHRDRGYLRDWRRAIFHLRVFDALLLHLPDVVLTCLAQV